jgi:hypothetical protein
VIVEEWDENEKEDDELLDLVDMLEDELELEEDDDDEELEKTEYDVLEAVVGSTKFPAVTVRICAPIADAPLNVVVEEVAVEVIVPRMAFTDLLHVP